MRMLVSPLPGLAHPERLDRAVLMSATAPSWLGHAERALSCVTKYLLGFTGLLVVARLVGFLHVDDGDADLLRSEEDNRSKLSGRGGLQF